MSVVIEEHTVYHTDGDGGKTMGFFERCLLTGSILHDAYTVQHRIGCCSVTMAELWFRYSHLMFNGFVWVSLSNVCVCNA